MSLDKWNCGYRTTHANNCIRCYLPNIERRRILEYLGTLFE